MDSIKRALLEKARVEYNNRLRRHYMDSVSTAYREKYVEAYSRQMQKEFADSVSNHNQVILVHYNDSVMRVVNDSINNILQILTSYAENDSVSVWLQNTSSDSTHIWLRKNDPHFTRLFIKNEQNDSLGIKIENAGKHSLRLLIDDGVTFSRFSRRRTREVKFPGFQPRQSSLDKVSQRYRVDTPWTLTGKANLGFTQTALSNWKAGGENALAFLFVFNGEATYAKNDISWKNTMELRNGWVKPGGDRIEKNDDEIELISRFGVKAAEKWNYSAEADFQTQLFNGYNYPDRENLISALMSPADIVLKLGFDYSPNKNFSLLLSPLSSKTIYVSNKNVDVTNFGIEEGKNAYWQAGFNTDLDWKKELTPDVIYTTKYKMFMNYGSPFSKFDVDWQNNLSMQLSTFINMNVMFRLVYDDDVKFDTGRVDAEGNDITEARWQIKELISLGFSYKLTKQVYRRRRIR